MRRVWAAFMIGWLAVAMQSQGQPRWRWSNPQPHGATIFDQASLGSLVAQVGEFGQLYLTDDLDNWMPRPTGVTNSLRSATFFGVQLVVTASDGVILYSESEALSRFIKVDLGTADWIEDVTAAAGRLVAVGDRGAIYTSLNATNWQRLAPDAGDWLTSVAYGAGRFVAVGYEGYVTSSTNGTTWSAGARLGTNDLNKIVFLNNQFWALGNNGFVRRSDNGLSWTSTMNVGTTNDLFDAASDGQVVVVAGRMELRVSASPFSSWTNKTSSATGAPPPWTYYSALWDGAEFLVAGRSGMFIEGFRTNTNSAITWVNDSDVPRNWFWSMISMDGIFAVCGEAGGIFTSGNGFHFDQEAVPTAARSEILEGIGGTTNLLVAVGTAGTVLYSPGGFTNVVMTNNNQVTTQRVSLLGLNWQAATKPTLSELQGVGVLGSLYIITGGQGSIYTSPNGTTWTPRFSGVSKMLSSVTASPTRAIAVGDLGALTISDNGTLWNAQNPPVTNWIYQARYLNNQFVAVGEAGLIMTSSNGVAWTRRSSGTTVWLNNLAYAEGSYYVIGGQGTILRSTNSINWTMLPPFTPKSLYGIAAQQGQLVIAGVEGAIIRSRLQPFSNGVDFLNVGREGTGLGFLLTGELDQPFRIEKTDTFTNWLSGPELEITDDSGLLIYFEGFAGRSNRMFYRTSLLPP